MATTNKNFKVKNGLDVNGEINASAVGGDEGGQINLAKPATGTDLVGNVAIDIYQNKIRIFDAGGSARGAYIDLSAAGEGVGSNLLDGGSGTASDSFKTISANGTSVVADSSTDTLTITPGSGMSIVGNATSDTVTFSVDYAEKIYYLVRNNTGSTIPKGTLVSASGAEPSGRIDVAPHSTTGTQDSELRVMGMVTANISNGVNGEVISFGTLVGIDTRGDTASAIAVGDETWAEGDILYAHPTVAGKLTNVRPQHDLAVAFITVRHASTGQIAVRIVPGNSHLEWLHDVNIDGTPADNELLAYNSNTATWINKTAEEAGVANLSGATFTGNVTATSFIGNTNASTITTGTIENARTTANSANGASTIIARDESGNFAANQAQLVSQKFGTGAGAPSFNAYNAGVRTIYYDNIGESSAGYAVGINSGELWHTTSDTTGTFKWYGGTTLAGELTGTGTFTATNVNATTFTGSGSGLTNIPNGATTATDANGASTIVARDASGNFSTHSVTFTGDIEAVNAVFTGNVTVQGSMNVVDTTNYSVRDNMIYLNQAGAFDITNAVGNGTAVVYTVPGHDLSVGDYVVVTGVDPSGYNIEGTELLEIDSVATDTVTVLKTDTGTYISGGTMRGKSHENPDLGWAAGRTALANGIPVYGHTGIFRDATDATYKFFDGYTPEPDESQFIDTDHASFALAPILAGGITSPTLRLTSTDDVNLTSTTHAFQIGESSGINLRVDGNEIQVLNNGATGTLFINNEGGPVNIGTTGGSNVVVNGGLSLAQQRNALVVSGYNSASGAFAHANKVIMSANATGSAAPTTRPDGTSLAAGDIWISW